MGISVRLVGGSMTLGAGVAALAILAAAGDARGQAPPPASSAPSVTAVPSAETPPPAYPAPPPPAVPYQRPPAGSYAPPPPGSYPPPPPGSYPPPPYGYPPPYYYGQPYGYPPPPPPPQPGAPPEAAAVEPFGRHRQLVLTGGLGFISDSSTTTSFSITPAADYFVANNFSLGAGLGYNKSTYTQNFSSNTYSSTFVTLRIAWNIPIGPRTSIWPMASPKYATANAAPDVASINVEVPLLIHIVPHFFLAVGPFLSIDHQIADSSSGYPGDTRTSRGIDTFIGGWW